MIRTKNKSNIDYCGGERGGGGRERLIMSRLLFECRSEAGSACMFTKGNMSDNLLSSSPHSLDSLTAWTVSNPAQ